MGHINYARVLLGGLAAGVVVAAGEALLNGVFLKDDWAAAMSSLGKSPEMTIVQMAGYNLWALLFGLSAVWFYAAIRPRFGAGPSTAVCAGLAIWFVGYALSTAAALISETLPAKLLLVAVAWGLVEVLLATLAGCWLYREDNAA